MRRLACCEANFALEIGLRIVIYAENHRGLVALKRYPLILDELACAIDGRASRNLEIDRGFGKSAEEVTVSYETAEKGGKQPKQKDMEIGPASKPLEMAELSVETTRVLRTSAGVQAPDHWRTPIYA